MYNVEQVFEDLNKLDVDYSKLKKTFEQLTGTRLIIQYANEDYSFSLSKTIKPKVRCFGVTNRCDDGDFIFFADYDKVYKSVMLKNLDNLIQKFPKQFDNFYIVKTGQEEFTDKGDVVGSYHVINFVKHTKKEIQEFLKYCDVDPFFVEIPDKTAHKTHVLRISQKFFAVDGRVVKEQPKFMHIYPITLLESGKKCSNAHYQFFKDQWGSVPVVNHLFDDLTKIELHNYLTPNKKTDNSKVKVVVHNE